MRLLLDTHALLWWFHEERNLSRRSHDAISDGGNEVVVSAVSAMEIAIKARKERLEYRTDLSTRFADLVRQNGFGLLSIGCDHSQLAGGLACNNPDPWDRLLAAQARIEGLALVTKDRAFASLDVQTFW